MNIYVNDADTRKLMEIAGRQENLHSAVQAPRLTLTNRLTMIKVAEHSFRARSC